MKSPLRVLFLGTAQTAVAELSVLIANPEYELVGVVTQPDRPAGRKQLLTPSPVKTFLMEQEYDQHKIFQPEKIKLAANEILKNTSPDIIVVVAYGQILPKALLDYPKHKCINVHFSLLPTYRGAIPVQAALINGDKYTGVSIIEMTPNLDDGPVLAETQIEILPEDDANSLLEKLPKIGAQMLLEVLPNWVTGKIDVKTQEELAVEYGRKLRITKTTDLDWAKAEILLNMDLQQASNLVRAFAASGGAWCEINYRGQKNILKIWSTTRVISTPNEITELNLSWQNGELLLNLQSGSICVSEVQLAGRQKASSQQYKYLTED